MKYYYNIKEKYFFSKIDDDYQIKKNEFEVAKEIYDEYLDKTKKGYICSISKNDNDISFTCVERKNKTDLEKQKALNKLRAKRKLLLIAYDKYKSNVLYGAITEDMATKSRIIFWYKQILDLKEDALNNVPNEIQRYL